MSAPTLRFLRSWLKGSHQDLTWGLLGMVLGCAVDLCAFPGATPTSVVALLSASAATALSKLRRNMPGYVMGACASIDRLTEAGHSTDEMSRRMKEEIIGAAHKHIWGESEIVNPRRLPAKK